MVWAAPWEEEFRYWIQEWWRHYLRNQYLLKKYGFYYNGINQLKSVKASGMGGFSNWIWYCSSIKVLQKPWHLYCLKRKFPKVWILSVSCDRTEPISRQPWLERAHLYWPIKSVARISPFQSIFFFSWLKSMCLLYKYSINSLFLSTKQM